MGKTWQWMLLFVLALVGAGAIVSILVTVALVIFGD
jgi:hypothetical protein